MKTSTVIDVATTEIGTEELRASHSTIFGRFLFCETLFIIIFISYKILIVFQDNIEDIIGNIKLILDTDFARNRSRHTLSPLYNNFHKILNQFFIFYLNRNNQDGVDYSFSNS